ncbi:large-conductance mechanosensitive channel [Zafaria cholistanensis]|uniref:Large-conductance mechanosensitive channel n=2 Tax=Zafaria cholistanensis TaxID=1682741 RepID=A0A5A7NLL7_9MICC|nr:large-conductance mechanosensitive channel [Zafaria cholistanensis]
MKGNVVDLAVAVVIGTAFSGVVNALVKNVLMPLVSAIVGSPNFDQFAAITINGNTVQFGVFLTALVNFLLISAAVYFVIVMPMNKMIEFRDKKLHLGKKPEPEAEPEPIPADIQLLTEIRDALKNRA